MPQVSGEEAAHLEVPVHLLHRLVQSPRVPLETKLAAVQSCRRELREMWSDDLRELDGQLALVEAALRAD